MYKSQNEWRNEADDFLYAWGYPGGSFPEYRDVLDVCRDLDADPEQARRSCGRKGMEGVTI